MKIIRYNKINLLLCIVILRQFPHKTKTTKTTTTSTVTLQSIEKNTPEMRRLSLWSTHRYTPYICVSTVKLPSFSACSF